jgi:hypothetical protein
MLNSKIKHSLYRLGLLLLLTGIILPAGSALAQESRSGGLILPEYYPARFSGHGCLNRINENEVVIDDRLYKLESDATYHTPQSEYASRSRFREGVRVGFVKKGNRTIQSLWYIDKCW